MFVSALINPAGPPAGIVRAVRAEREKPIVCPHLLSELGVVLMRPKFLRYVTPREVASYLEVITDRADHALDPAQIPARCRDPKDDYLLALADQEHADQTVSGDADLLSMTTSPPVMSPRAFLDSLDAVS